MSNILNQAYYYYEVIFMGQKFFNLKSKIVEQLEIPKDAVLNIPRITIAGDQELCIENHKGIVEYSDTVIRINVGTGIIKVVGENLSIHSILTDELLIEGKLKNIIL